MQIDPTNNLNFQNLADSLYSQPAQTDKRSPSVSANDDVQTEYSAIIKKAMQQPEPDPDAIARCKELIDSGLLDSPENVESAAENFLRFGA
ncbi:MAG: hypothetical protein ACYSUX_19445 [Planctomycetota bacterium]|jgi:hypothetical protein